MFAVVTLSVTALLSAALMFGGHYGAPRLAGRDLHRLESYAWGCGLGIWLPFSGWAAFWFAFHDPAMPAWLPVAALATVIGGAGLGTLAAWALDTWAGHRAAARLQ